MPSAVSSASSRSPASRWAALRMSSGKVSWPLERSVVRATTKAARTLLSLHVTGR
jgi:hypothetical protein